ncbi:hypothetical protein A3Q56_00388 [Intoshia linei]|uniref:Uncharacterized protein n=1 Tax=Intoshia linei TaxID=1819745 RepID=A0A177BC72_9BILA|nr:hypothetical protein A3Q56_00388 [Intoshia linei]
MLVCALTISLDYMPSSINLNNDLNNSQVSVMNQIESSNEDDNLVKNATTQVSRVQEPRICRLTIYNDTTTNSYYCAPQTNHATVDRPTLLFDKSKMNTKHFKNHLLDNIENYPVSVPETLVQDNVQYQIGDNIYIDIKRPECPYKICKILYFKTNKRDNVFVCTKNYLRVNDLSTNVYYNLQSDRKNSEENFKCEDKIAHRELFFTESTEMYSALLIRGKVNVMNFDNISVVYKDFKSSIDTYYSIYNYNTETKRLSTRDGQVRIGKSQQADIPDLVDKSEISNTLPNQKCHKSESMSVLVWEPNKISNVELKKYITSVRKLSQNCASVEPYIAQYRAIKDPYVLPFISKSDDIANHYDRVRIDDIYELSLETLFNQNYKTDKALKIIRKTEFPKSLNEIWSLEDVKKFEKGIRQYGKDFFRIHNEHLKHKNPSELIEYYYYWKKYQVEGPTKNRRYRAVNPYKRFRRIQNQIDSDDQTSTSECSETEEIDGKIKEHNGYYCRNCFTIVSKNWHHSGFDRKLFCFKCRIYFKQYGTARQVDENKCAPQSSDIFVTLNEQYHTPKRYLRSRKVRKGKRRGPKKKENYAETPLIVQPKSPISSTSVSSTDGKISENENSRDFPKLECEETLKTYEKMDVVDERLKYICNSSLISCFFKNINVECNPYSDKNDITDNVNSKIQEIKFNGVKMKDQKENIKIETKSIDNGNASKTEQKKIKLDKSNDLKAKIKKSETVDNVEKSDKLNKCIEMETDKLSNVKFNIDIEMKPVTSKSVANANIGEKFDIKRNVQRSKTPPLTPNVHKKDKVDANETALNLVIKNKCTKKQKMDKFEYDVKNFKRTKLKIYKSKHSAFHLIRNITNQSDTSCCRTDVYFQGNEKINHVLNSQKTNTELMYAVKDKNETELQRSNQMSIMTPGNQSNTSLNNINQKGNAATLNYYNQLAMKILESKDGMNPGPAPRKTHLNYYMKNKNDEKLEMYYKSLMTNNPNNPINYGNYNSSVGDYKSQVMGLPEKSKSAVPFMQPMDYLHKKDLKMATDQNILKGTEQTNFNPFIHNMMNKPDNFYHPGRMDPRYANSIPNIMNPQYNNMQMQNQFPINVNLLKNDNQNYANNQTHSSNKLMTDYLKAIQTQNMQFPVYPSQSQNLNQNPTTSQNLTQNQNEAYCQYILSQMKEFENQPKNFVSMSDLANYLNMRNKDKKYNYK